MAQDTTPSLIMCVGNGTQTFEVPFDKGAYGEIKVAFVRRGLTDYTYNPDTYNVTGYLYAWNGGVYTKTEQPDTTTPLYDKDGVATGDDWTEGMYREPKNDIFTHAELEWTGEPLTEDDVICIVRDTTKNQPYTYQNNQKHIERAIDNLSRQIQEVAKKVQNALIVDPAWMSVADGGLADEDKMDPVTWLQTIVRSTGKTLRELRVNNNYVMYTADDPDADEKTWEVVAGVKTDNAGVISHIREHQGANGAKYLQYSVDGGATWNNASASVYFSDILGNPTDNTALATALSAKQDVISDLSTIRSGATAGATAVQPSDLATVATSGSYNDLSNKPTIPTVNNATLTITQGGVSKGTFTANAASDVSIEIGSSLPSQTGNSGKFLTTDGTEASWATVDALPSQTSQSGKFLTTDGTDASWKGLELTDITGSAAVTTVATNIADVNTVAADTTNIDTVATNIADVNTCATNITAIQNASTNAENAEKWAEGTDAQVSPLGGTHSSKGWAAQAQNYAISADDSRMTAQNAVTSAQGYATAAATSAQQALQNSQKLMVSINKANCWSRTYTGLDTEKRYQLVTANTDWATPIVSNTVYTTQENISDVPVCAIPGKHPGFIIGNTWHTKNFANDANLQFNNTTWLDLYYHLDNTGRVYQLSNAMKGTFNSGWTVVTYFDYLASAGYYGFGVKDGKLYSVVNTVEHTGAYYAYFTASLLDDTGTWTYVRGCNKSGTSFIGLGIKDGKLYKIENLTVSLLDDNLAWTPESLMHNAYDMFDYDEAVALINSEIYGIDASGVYPTNFNLSIKKMNGIGKIITTDGKLYRLDGRASTLYITQVGSDTDWADISWGYLERYLAIKGGDLVLVFGDTVVSATTGKSYVGVAGQFGNAAFSQTNTFVVWEQTPVVHTEKAYTTPTSTVGDNLYGTTSLGNPRAIVSIDASTVSDGTNTYTRDSTGDTYFVGRPDTFVSTNLTTGDVVDALSN